MDDAVDASSRHGIQPEGRAPRDDEDTASIPENAPVVGSSTESNKLDELLKAFQTQLDLQQKQLALLRTLTKSVDKTIKTALTRRAINQQDYHRAMQWASSLSPSSPLLESIKNSEFLSRCRTSEVLWFSKPGSVLGDNEKFASVYSKYWTPVKRQIEGQPCLPNPLVEELKKNWPPVVKEQRKAFYNRAGIDRPDHKPRMWNLNPGRWDPNASSDWFLYNENGEFHWKDVSRAYRIIEASRLMLRSRASRVIRNTHGITYGRVI